MSAPAPQDTGRHKLPAHVFAALGDPVRLTLLERLGREAPLSITRLTGDTGITRQAISKHLAVLESAGLVRPERIGREMRYAPRPEGFRAAQTYLEAVSVMWDEALARLAAHVEAKG